LPRIFSLLAELLRRLLPSWHRTSTSSPGKIGATGIVGQSLASSPPSGMSMVLLGMLVLTSEQSEIVAERDVPQAASHI
jgi:hypothetical protein